MSKDELTELFRAAFGVTGAGERATNKRTELTLMNVSQQGFDTHGILCVRPQWIAQERKITARIPGGLVIQIQLTQVMRDGVQLRIKGKSQTGGDLYLHLQISE
jgi:hypothetical protein